MNIDLIIFKELDIFKFCWNIFQKMKLIIIYYLLK